MKNLSFNFLTMLFSKMEKLMPRSIDDAYHRSHRNRGRKIMSRIREESILIIDSLKPGKHISSCLVCCDAPSCCALCATLPCCGHPKYITLGRESSKYIYIRENSLEWNDPEIVMMQGPCFGVDPCMYDIRDRVTVIYFDDPIFDRITDRTRFCNEGWTCLFGGQGERIQIDSPCCFNLCLRAPFPCMCVPICFPKCLFPCILKYDIYVEDAKQAMFQIHLASEGALKDSLYCVEASTSNNNYFDNIKSEEVRDSAGDVA